MLDMENVLYNYSDFTLYCSQGSPNNAIPMITFLRVRALNMFLERWIIPGGLVN